MLGPPPRVARRSGRATSGRAGAGHPRTGSTRWIVRARGQARPDGACGRHPCVGTPPPTSSSTPPPCSPRPAAGARTATPRSGAPARAPGAAARHLRALPPPVRPGSRTSPRARSSAAAGRSRACSPAGATGSTPPTTASGAGRWCSPAAATATPRRPRCCAAGATPRSSGCATSSPGRGAVHLVLDPVDGTPPRVARCRPGERPRLVLGIVPAVAHLHRLGLLHADLKPGNVLRVTARTGPGRPRLGAPPRRPRQPRSGAPRDSSPRRSPPAAPGPRWPRRSTRWAAPSTSSSDGRCARSCVPAAPDDPPTASIP